MRECSVRCAIHFHCTLCNDNKGFHLFYFKTSSQLDYPAPLLGPALWLQKYLHRYTSRQTGTTTQKHTSLTSLSREVRNVFLLCSIFKEQHPKKSSFYRARLPSPFKSNQQELSMKRSLLNSLCCGLQLTFPHEQKTLTHNNTVLRRFSKERNVPGDDFHINCGERDKRGSVWMWSTSKGNFYLFILNLLPSPDIPLKSILIQRTSQTLFT